MKCLSGGRIPTAEDDEREGLVGHYDVLENITFLEREIKKSMMLKAGQACARNRGGGGRKLKK
jgi:hypothetical protein